ncbi:MAG: hypothetical protein DRZ90_01905 [Spirochaetes bacterium]|nr:MAG: hypothetical protein DRZ90_01905 [Spirochaetota bacterium]
MKQNQFTGRYAGVISAILLASLITVSARGENIRGEIAGTPQIGGPEIVFNPEDIVIVDTGTIPAFQEGIELRLEIPEALNRYQNSFALLIFRDITPSPSPDNLSYSGTRAYMRLLPSRTSAFIRIPFTENHGISGDALTDVLPVPVSQEQFPLLITVLPVMKGIPDSAFQQKLSITVVPLWKDEGSLTVSVANPSGNPEEIVNITVDGAEVTPGEETIFSAGIHRVRISSSHAPTVEKTIAIEPGEVLTLNLPLDYRPPEITVSIPEGAFILLDGEAVETKESLAVLETVPGDHIITYSLGNLEVNRHFTVRPGGKVRINLIIDIEIVDVGEGSGSEYGVGDG